jgi:putative oxidoreductase
MGRIKLKTLDLLEGKKAWLTECCSLLLIGLWVYTAFSKVYDAQGTYLGLSNQVFPKWSVGMLWVGLPILELLAALLLVLPSLRTRGFQLSVLLLSAFTVYIILVLTGIFGRVPCSCGGVLNSLGWWEHLWFNLFFLGLAWIGLKFKREK